MTQSRFNTPLVRVLAALVGTVAIVVHTGSIWAALAYAAALTVLEPTRG